MSSAGVPSFFPIPKDNDDDDVVWAMQTALVQWKRGGKADAVVWIRRAADSADGLGQKRRATELRHQAALLAERMWDDENAEEAAPASLEIDVSRDSDIPSALSLPPARLPGGLPPPPVRLPRLAPPPPARPLDDVVVDLSAGDLLSLDEDDDAPRLSVHSISDIDELLTVQELAEEQQQAEAREALENEQLVDENEFDDWDDADEITGEFGSMPEAVSSLMNRPNALKIKQPSLAPRPAPLVPTAPASLPPPPAPLVHVTSRSSAPPPPAPLVSTRSITPAPLVPTTSRSSVPPAPAPLVPPSVPRGPRLPSPALPVLPALAAFPPVPLLDARPESPVSADREAPFDESDAEFDILSIRPAADEDDADDDVFSLQDPADDADAAPTEADVADEDDADDDVFSLQGPVDDTDAAPTEADVADDDDAADDDAADDDAADDDAADDDAADDDAADDDAADDDTADDDAADDDAADDDPLSAPPLDLPIAASSEAPAALASGSTKVDGFDLTSVTGFEDMPLDLQVALAASARVDTLAEDEEVGHFGAALVTHGRVKIAPAIADLAGAYAAAGQVVFTRGSLAGGMELRVIASEPGTRVASWDNRSIDQALLACPWVADDLRALADRFHALCGVTLGVLGEGLDESLMVLATERMEVVRCAAGEVLLEAGSQLPGLYIVGAGKIELLAPDRTVSGDLTPGDIVYASEEMSARPAPQTVAGAPGGALLLFAPRALAHELITTIPPLLEVLSS